MESTEEKVMHTPGPWAVGTWETDPEEGSAWYVYAPNEKPLGAKDHFEVANFFTGDVKDQEELANARLCAAAPAMLEKLQEWVRDAELLMQSAAIDDRKTEMHLLALMKTQSESIIAKAIGQG